MNRSLFFRVFGIVLFVYIISRIDFAGLLTAFREIHIAYFLMGVLFLIISFFIRIIRWQILAASADTRLSFGRSASMIAKGLFFGAIVPGRLGEFWRARYLVKENGVAGGQAFYVAFIDRFLDIAVVAAIGFLGLIALYLKFGGLLGWWLPTMIFLCLVVLGYFLVKEKKARQILNAVIKSLVPDFLKEKADYFLTEFYKGFSGLKLKPLAQSSILAVLYYLVGGVALHYYIALSLGITISFWYLFLIVAIVWLVMAIPVSVFGLGTREAAFIYFLSFLSIPASSAVALSLLALFCNILIVTIPAALFFLKEK